MPSTRPWDENDPVDSDKVGTGASDVRNLRDDIMDRALEGGHAYDVSTTLDERHTVADAFKVYKTDRTTVHTEYTDGALTAQSGVNFVGGNVTTGDDVGHTHTRAIVCYVPGVLATGRIKTTFRLPRAFTFTAVKVAIFTRPATGTVTIDVLKLTAVGLTDDPAGAGSTIFTVKPTVTAANYRGEVSGFAIASVAANDELAFEIIAGGYTGSPADLTIEVWGKLG